MAGTATKTNTIQIGLGQGGRLMETHTILWDADATVNLKTILNKVEGATFMEVGSSGAITCRVDGTVTDNKIVVNAAKSLTIDASGTSVSKHVVTLTGY